MTTDGGRDTPRFTPVTPLIEIPRPLTREQIQQKFVNNMQDRSIKREDIRNEIDGTRLFTVYENKIFILKKFYHTYSSNSGDYSKIAVAYFHKDRDGNYKPTSVTRSGEGNQIALENLDSKDGQGIKLRLSFDLEKISDEADNYGIEVQYDWQGNISGIGDAITSDNPKSPVVSQDLWVSDEKEDGEHTVLGVVLPGIERYSLQAILQGKDLSIANGDRTTTVQYKKEHDQQAGTVVIERKRGEETILIKVSAKIDPTVSEKLFPTKYFSPDPFTVVPSDDAWMKEDWRTLVGVTSEHLWDMAKLGEVPPELV